MYSILIKNLKAKFLITQYVLIAIIPTIILNKCIQKLLPVANEEKNNMEILAEVLGQGYLCF